MNSNKTINIGLLVDSLEIPAWQYLALEKIKALSFVGIELVLVNQTDNSNGSWFYDGLMKLDYRHRKVTPYAFAPKKLNHGIADLPLIKLQHASEKGAINEQIENEIKKHGIDLWIQLGSGNFQNTMLADAPCGIWRFNDFDKDHLIVAHGFWETLQDKDQIEGNLQIQRGTQKWLAMDTTTSRWSVYIHKNANTHYWKMSSFLARKLTELRNQGGEAFVERLTPIKNDSQAPVKTPSFWSSLLPTMGYLYRVMMDKVYYKICKEQWVMLYSLNGNDLGSFGEFKKLEPPKHMFWADPFIIHKDNRYYIYFEEIIIKRNEIGHISLVIMDEQGNVSDPVKVLQRPYHLSYPFILHWQDNYYMIPETAQNKSIELYKCTNFPDQWEFQHNLINDVDACDATIIQYHQKWWLFTSIRENPGGSTWDELFVYYADDPTSQNWTPHPQNPVVSNTSSARPAGNIFIKDGELFRPSQNCARRYGYGLKINKIETLTTQEYSEVEVASYEPNWDKDIIGLHTLNQVGDLTIIDVLVRSIRFF